MTSPLFRRLLLIALVLVTATLLTVDRTLTTQARAEQRASIEHRLRAEATILAVELQQIPDSDLLRWVNSAATAAQAHIAVLDAGGAAIAESITPLLAQNPISVTVPVPRPGGPALTLRLSAPPTEIDQPELDAAARQTRIRILATCLGAALFALGVALLVTRALTRRVTRLKRLAEGMLGGMPQYYASYDSGDELASLERLLTSVADELKKLVDRLRFESARREAILAGMAEGVLAVDPDLRVTFCNTAFLRAVGFRGGTFEGLSLLELVRDPGLYGLLRSVLMSGQPDNLRFRLAAANSRAFQVQATALDMPAGRGALAILYDTTDLERLEQIRKDFVANVSHELRTPLAGIIGFTETLLDGALEDTANNKRFVEIIQNNAVRLGRIAEDLLVLSELESGTDPPEPEAISVRSTLESALVTVEAEARARDVRLVRGEIEDVWVGGSRLRLEQALLNLLANAVKFNRPGGEVRVSAGKSDGQVAIVVADTGVGIPSEDVPRIFERFYRVDRARSRQVGGTGLGLSIVKHVVERMNGRVMVESQLGKGSTFTLLLPLLGEPERD